MGTELHFEVGHALKHMTTTQLDLYATGPNSTLPVSNNLFCINDVIRVTESRNLGFAIEPQESGIPLKAESGQFESTKRNIWNPEIGK